MYFNLLMSLVLIEFIPAQVVFNWRILLAVSTNRDLFSFVISVFHGLGLDINLLRAKSLRQSLKWNGNLVRLVYRNIIACLSSDT
jgi:hypothetical protein